MVSTCVWAASALGVDAWVGDPRWLLHPVSLMGSVIAWYDRRFNRPDAPRPWLRLRGVLLAVLLPAAAGGLTWGILWGMGRIWPPLYWATAIWLTSTTIAWKGLYQAGRDVRRALAASLPEARAAVAQIVGRDTAALSEAEVVRAAVETLAENIVDGIVAPVCYAALGGAPLAMAYRAVNTLDSMVGYRNPRYQWFGWASARLDDVMNFIPARLSALVIWVVLAGLKLSPGQAWRTMRRDAARHESPNSGIPEALLAGGLGVQLGGPNYYHGVLSVRATLGTPRRPLVRSDVDRALRVVAWSGAVLGIAVLAVGVWA